MEDTMIPTELDIANDGLSPKEDFDRSGVDIASLKKHPGWKLVEEYIDTQIQQTAEFDLNGLSIDTIGYYHLATKLLHSHLNAIKMLVTANYDHEFERSEQERKGTTES